ncbi:rhodanese-like domain-containing protein [Maridesulfovibrio salexigens]|uniref:Rhodanese domain protein n=1 Tax=Maridesulfovibrio salexigens (strain ATCC 14822 / DSM 2638 / NCIMB 8403 / VKM B-1763) TaxID=526222 RepID=C6BVV2_MARSD|nr:rhodanese-like domain-containing protein [Maridesulfovibrio salexigens]ACS80155.1 Rhodanese domain protein [Maridesulfovibrio salexigens DSM 2638]
MKFGKVAAFLVKVILICVISGGLAVAFNTARSKPYTFAELSHPQPPEIGEIGSADLLQDFTVGKYFFVDARSDMEFAMGHIPGALNITTSMEGDEFAAQVAQIDRNLPVIVYCDGLSCGKSLIVAKKLVEQGFKDVTVYTEGIDGWIGAGMDLEAN